MLSRRANRKGIDLNVQLMLHYLTALTGSALNTLSLLECTTGNQNPVQRAHCHAERIVDVKWVCVRMYLHTKQILVNVPNGKIFTGLGFVTMSIS